MSQLWRARAGEKITNVDHSMLEYQANLMGTELSVCAPYGVVDLLTRNYQISRLMKYVADSCQCRDLYAIMSWNI